ncbi:MULTISPECIES: glycosyltransferase [unclassified Gemella]|uniref:glycosyltransferase family 2 protein n=1 Tax=unclassified Gemella TaxID=2624949 RepID=UPI001C05CC52|nr:MULTISPECIES: glycosyltransferase [unclassified Gemella]MBU0279239.1 glycosyltransferase family 2 protein [Gemella sp. zg-1178]QWQ39046.1 glycosyltransferase family 2 protein [Gemella sp. zg-570]
MYLTIAVAVYNGENYLERCLNSISKSIENYKGNKEVEVLVINDGSKDNSEVILRNYSNIFKNYVLINKENGGLSSVRNYAVENAKGKFLWMIDVDDEIIEDAVSNVLDRIDSDINIFNYTQISNKKIQVSLDRIILQKDFILSDNKKILLTAPSSWKFIFNTEFIRNTNLKFLDRTLYEDLNISPKLLTEAKSISSFDIDIYKYYINSNSIMTNKDIEKKKDIFIVMKDLKKYFEEKNILDTYYAELEYLHIHHMLYVSYVSIIQIDKNSKVLKELRDYVNNIYHSWLNNKYLQKENIMKRTILKYVYSDNRLLVISLLKIKEILQKFL